MKIKTITLFSLLFCAKVIDAQEIITRVSVTSEGNEANLHSFAPSISGDGRYVTFQSEATNLVADDDNGFTDIFLYDRYTNELKLISRNLAGKSANFKSNFATISQDGHYIVFQSDASDLVANDTNQVRDVFIYSIESEKIELISINNQGIQGDAPSSFPVLSADGRYVAFDSDATNLVTDDTKNYIDVFVHDRTTHETTRISVNSRGKQVNSSSYGASISGDGRYVAYVSNSRSLAANDTNKTTDIFVHDRENGSVQRISLNNEGIEGNAASYEPRISLDGQWVVFTSWASNLVPDDTNQARDIFLYNLTTAMIERVSVNNQGKESDSASFAPHISGNNRYIVFNSEADNLVIDDDNKTIDVFIYDHNTRQINRMTPYSQTFSSGAASFYPPAISDDGRFVAYESKALNLTATDFNESSDIFVYDRDYCAIYQQATQIGYIPALMVADTQFYRAHLIFNPAENNFKLQTYNKVRLPLENVQANFTPTTDQLSVPCVEVYDVNDVLIQQVEVELSQIGDDPLTFQLTTEKLIQSFKQ